MAKRASYREAVNWIARNDSAGDSDAGEIEAVSYLVSTLLIADIFDKEPTEVGAAIIKRREALGIL